MSFESHQPAAEPQKKLIPGTQAWDEFQRERHYTENLNYYIWELAMNMEKIVDKIRENIHQHEYGVVLGIDSSGRAPGLFMGKFLKEVYQHDGIRPPKTTFVAGFRARGHSSEAKAKDRAIIEERKKKLQEYFSLAVFQAIKGKQTVLLVEDTVGHGESLRGVVEALKLNGLDHEMITLNIQTSAPDEYPIIIMDKEVIFGDFGRNSSLYNQREMSGVHKDREKGPLFSQSIGRPLRTDVSEEDSDKKQREFDRIYSHKAREMITVEAHKLAEKFIRDREGKKGSE
jgi:bisphosphoglycerate-dependent phosphoglycerate mutase